MSLDGFIAGPHDSMDWVVSGWSEGGENTRDIGYDAETKRFHTTFFDSQRNVSTEELSVDGTTWKWAGNEVRCTGLLEDDGQRMVCHHERLEGESWVPSMDVTLTRVD